MDPALDLTLRTGLALLFLAAASHKARDLGRFRAMLADYRLLPAAAVAPGALLVLALEGAVAVGLLAPGCCRPALCGAAALLVTYGAAMAVNLARGRRDLDCGCAGPATRRPISGRLVARNAVLAASALAGLAPVAARPLEWVDALTVAGATATVAMLYAALDRMLASAPALARLRGGA